jgi:predicted HicB family RNase H-like nuclease
MNIVRCKQYVGVFDFDPEAKLFHGDVVGIRDVVTFQGKSVTELEQALKDSVEEYLALCNNTGKKPDEPYSGEIKLRLGPDLHREVATAAVASGLSLNAWMKKALERHAQEARCDGALWFRLPLDQAPISRLIYILYSQSQTGTPGHA